MKSLLIFIVFLLGASALSIAMLFKLMHWPGMFTLNIAGVTLVAVAVVLLIIKLFRIKN